MMTLTAREQAEINQANASGRPVVVFIHGLWLLAESWAGWRELFESRGYATVAPGWPDDPETVEAARATPAVFARKSVKQIVDRLAGVVRALKSPPMLVGHSFGGLFVQMLAGQGLSAASVAIDPGPFRGVLPLPFSALKVASAVIANPFNRARAVTLTPAQFRYGFGNAVSAEESEALYARHHVAGSGVPLFQAAAANLNPFTEVTVDTRNPSRGPLLIISGEKDHTVPPAMANAAFARQRRNPALTELTEMAGRGHSLIIDSGWKDVAEVALAFLAKQRV